MKRFNLNFGIFFQRIFCLRSSLFLLSIFFLYMCSVACSNKKNFYAINNKANAVQTYTPQVDSLVVEPFIDRFTVKTNQEKKDKQAFDLIFVIDNSQSMAAFNDKLAANFNAFIELFEANKDQYDYKIGVITINHHYSGGPIPTNTAFSYDPADKGLYPNKNAILQSSDGLSSEQLKSRFAEMANVRKDSNGDNNPDASDRGPARGMESLIDFLENTDDGKNFLRPKAHLNVVIITDVDEYRMNPNFYLSKINDDSNTGNDAEGYSIPYPAKERVYGYENYFFGELKRIKGDEKFSVSAVVSPEVENTTTCAGSSKGLFPAKRYRKLAKRTGGEVYDICNNFNSIMTELSQSIADDFDAFSLTKEHTSDSIKKVLMNGVAQTKGTHWFYQKGGIVFYPDFLPEKEDEVEIHYVSNMAPEVSLTTTPKKSTLEVFVQEIKKTEGVDWEYDTTQKKIVFKGSSFPNVGDKIEVSYFEKIAF